MTPSTAPRAPLTRVDQGTHGFLAGKTALADRFRSPMTRSGPRYMSTLHDNVRHESHLCSPWRRLWRIARLVMACSLSGCQMSHVEAAKEALDDEEPVIVAEPEGEPEEPGGEDGPEELGPGDGPQGPGPGPGPGPPGPTQNPALSIAHVSAAEDDGTLTFLVSLSRAPGTTVSVQYATENGTAEADTDYVFTSGTLRFHPDRPRLSRSR